MRKQLFAIIIILSIGASCNYGYKEIRFPKKETPAPVQPQPVAKAVTAETYVHYNANYCLACHIEIPKAGSSKSLKYEGNFQLLCKCHFASSQTYLHPVDVEPSRAYKLRMTNSFPLFENKITCNTCHDIYIQCQEDQKLFQKQNMFLRKSPSETNTDFCFKCHEEAKFSRYNPHKQLDSKGAIIDTKCLYCHSQIPDVQKTGYSDAKLIGDIKALCQRCHSKLSRQSLHDRHLLRKPSVEILATIRRLQDQYNVILPLSENNELVCATCHNPHEKGAIPVERAGSKGAGEHHRHRLPGNLCMKCHQM